MKPYIFGVDLGGTTVKIGLFENEELLDKWEIPTRTEENGKYILGDIADSILLQMQKRGISPDEIRGVGIDVPGAVLEDGTVNRCVNLGWGVLVFGEYKTAKERVKLLLATFIILAGAVLLTLSKG